jgi:hypothetical protein
LLGINVGLYERCMTAFPNNKRAPLVDPDAHRSHGDSTEGRRAAAVAEELRFARNYYDHTQPDFALPHWEGNMLKRLARFREAPGLSTPYLYPATFTKFA